MKDKKLPGLDSAVNDQEMQRIFVASKLLFPAGGISDRTKVRHKVLKHTRGKRCVIEYEIEREQKLLKEYQIIGKIYRKDRGEKIFDYLQVLWHKTRNNRNGHSFFGMPEPKGYIPELRMVLQSRVPGMRLSEITENKALQNAIRLVAKNLAILHGLSISAGERKYMNDHLKKFCHPGPQVLIERFPGLRKRIEGILAGLSQEGILANAPIRPVHGDLGLSQIFITEDHAYFIDFDGFCQTHPALDLANFLAVLEAHFEDLSRELATIFLETYLESSSSQMLTGLKYYQALICLRRAMICFRTKTEPQWYARMQNYLEIGKRCFAERNNEVPE